MLEETTYGNPEKVVHYTSASQRSIQKRLQEEQEISVSPNTVGNVIEQAGYSRQQNKKLLQDGKSHPDRDAQFGFIEKKIEDFTATGDPVISVDTKKKEVLGNYKNGGTEYRKKNDPRPVLDHDFPKGVKVSPYGIYDIGQKSGYVVLGTSHDTPRFAVNSIKAWWESQGSKTYKDAKRIIILCDAGGSNSA